MPAGPGSREPLGNTSNDHRPNMVNNPNPKRKKSRIERDQTFWMVISTIIVAALLVVLIIYFNSGDPGGSFHPGGSHFSDH